MNSDNGASEVLEHLDTDPAEWTAFLAKNFEIVMGETGIAHDMFTHAIDAGLQQERFKVLGLLDELASKATSREEVWLIEQAIDEITVGMHHRPLPTNVVSLRPGQPVPTSSDAPEPYGDAPFRVVPGTAVHDPTLDVTTSLVSRLIATEGPVEGHPVAQEVHQAISTALFHLEFGVKLGPARSVEDQIAIVAETAFLWLMLRLGDPARVAGLFTAKAERPGPEPEAA